MPLPAKDVIGILSDNLRLRDSVLPIPKRAASGWARKLDLPRGGKTVLYSGQMIQLIPYIEGLVRWEERLGDSFLARLTFLGRFANRFVNLSAFMARPTKRTRAPYDAILTDVATVLRSAGVEFGYLYEDDLYSGALTWDLGADEVVAEHAKKVYEGLKRHGVEQIITIDPHTTNMLRSVYPKLVDGYDLEVASYLEVLAERGLVVRAPLAGEVVLHDSCIFARFENVTDQPRRLLAEAGLTIREPEHSGRLTWCCGGPAESLYPKKALAQAAHRVEELRAAASEAVTMCPLCLVNLQKAAGETLTLRDISSYLSRSMQ
jgi:hypothetical protein